MTIGATATGGIMTILNGVETDYPAGAFSSFQLTVGATLSKLFVLATVVPTTVTGPGSAGALGKVGTATVGSNGNLQGIQQPLTFLGYENTLDDSADTSPHHVTIGPNATHSQTVHGLAPVDISGAGFVLLGHASGNIVDVSANDGVSINANTPVGGLTTINFQSQSFGGYQAYVTDTGAGTTVVNIDDSSDTTAQTAGIGSNSSYVTAQIGSSGFNVEQAANLLLNLKCGSGGNTVSIGYFNGVNNATFNIDSGSGNDTTTLLTLPAGVTVNVNGDAGNDSFDARYYSGSGVCRVSNTAGKTALTIDQIGPGGNAFTFNKWVPAGTTEQWQRMTALLGGEIDYDPAGMLGSVLVRAVNSGTSSYTILNTPDYPAPAGGTTPTADLSLSVAGTVYVKGLGANAVVSYSPNNGPIDVDFGAGQFGAGSVIQIPSGFQPLIVHGANAADAFSLTNAGIVHGSTTIQCGTDPVELMTGTFSVPDLTSTFFLSHTFQVVGSGATLQLTGNCTQPPNAPGMHLYVDGGRAVFLQGSVGQITYFDCQWATFVNGGELDIGGDTVAVPPSSWYGAALAAGYNNGKWNGPGIVSSALTAGYAIGTGYIPTTGWTFMRKALTGDTNLDGSVNLKDFLTLTRYFGSGYSNWQYGDFNYDGSVTLTDLLALTRSFGKTDPPLAAVASAYAAATPPPTTGGTSLSARRRIAL